MSLFKINRQSDLLQRSAIEVKASPLGGLGVFAKSFISAPAIIEQCPVVIFPRSKNVDLKDLYNYVVAWQENDLGMPLGYGGLYNHSDTPNAQAYFDYEKQYLFIIAKKNIYRGEEICINYGEEWFPSRQMVPKEVPLRRKLFGIPYFGEILLGLLSIAAFYTIIKGIFMRG